MAKEVPLLQTNSYMYCGNNPINKVDMNGTFWNWLLDLLRGIADEIIGSVIPNSAVDVAGDAARAAQQLAERNLKAAEELYQSTGDAAMLQKALDDYRMTHGGGLPPDTIVP